MTKLQRLRSPFTVHERTSGEAASDGSTPLALLIFLFESSNGRPVNICEMKSFPFNKSVLDARKPNFYPHFVYKVFLSFV